MDIKDYDTWMNEMLFDFDETESGYETTVSAGEDDEMENCINDLNQSELKEADKNLHNLVTCLMPDDPAGKIIFNRKTTVLKKKMKRLGNKIFNIPLAKEKFQQIG